MNKTLFLVAALAGFGAFAVSAAEPAKASPTVAALKAVAAPELPAKAAALVKNAKGSQRGMTVVDVTKAAVSVNPASAPAIVGAIAKTVPAMAALSAGAAAAEQPAQAAAIAKAATAAAPGQAAEIVVAVCRAVPNEYRAIALAASQAAPGSSRQILRAIAQAIPDLKPGIDQALAAGSAPSVAATLDTVKPATRTASATSTGSGSTPGTLGVRGPVVAPPYVPLSGTPNNVNPGNSGQQPTGGRNYAAP